MDKIITIKNRVLKGEAITFDEAQYLIKTENIHKLFNSATEIRETYFQKKITLCSIVNAKSGKCSEDCQFCAQSSKYTTASPLYPLKDLKEIKSSVDEANSFNASSFSVVTSGKNVKKQDELCTIADTMEYIKKNHTMNACCSLGLMGKDELLYLKSKGLERVHHNLETSRSFFPKIVSTRTYDDQIKAVRLAKELGFHVCSGGIFGMGESWDQRLELAFDLRNLEVDSIPINFLDPIPGTPLESQPLLNPMDALKIIAMFRFIFPSTNIMIMGGREKVLRDLQSWLFYAGANGFLIGNYLVTKGRSIEDDIKMIEDLGLVPENK